MAGRFVRASKFRHIFGTQPKTDACYCNIRITKSPHDSNMSAVNKKFLAVVLESQGGGAFVVIPLTKVGRLDINCPKVAGHKNLVMDVAWNPFDDNQIASSSEDCTVKLWNIPDGGLTETLTEPVKDLSYHQRKVGYIAWHPTASNVLASAGHDNIIVIWNTQTEEPINVIDEVFPDQIYSICWNYNGQYIAASCKDKMIRVLNPRTSEVISEGKCHDGNKPSKITFCGKTNQIFSTGFARSSGRQYALWDSKDLSKPLCIENVDTGSGVTAPFFDQGNSVVYLVGKGDTTIRYFEVNDKSPFVHFLSLYQPKGPQRGACVLPKREVDYMQCEVMRFYRLTNSGNVEPTPMTVPRKSDMFQEDIFPPCPSDEPALTAEEWQSGTDKNPNLLKFTKNGLEKTASGAAPEKIQGGSAKKASGGGGGSKLETLDDYKKAYSKLLEENAKLKKRVAELEGK